VVLAVLIGFCCILLNSGCVRNGVGNKTIAAVVIAVTKLYGARLFMPSIPSQDVILKLRPA
jgi:hypothetical protein